VDFNAALAAYLDTLPEDIEIFKLDVFALAGQFVSTPATFGFTDVTSACWNGLSVCTDPSAYLYWDQIHPTTAAHEIIGSAARAMVPAPHQNIVAGDGAAGDRFGQAVSTSVDWLAVGAPRDDVDGQTNQGSVYLQRRIGSMVFPFQKLSEGLANDRFGLSVSISGDWLAVGAPLDDVSGNVDQGSVYLYTWNGTSWSLQQTLTDPGGAAGDQFGYAISIAGDTLVVTAPLDDVGTAVDRGSAFAYQRNGNSWTPTQQLLGPTGAAGDEFGDSVSLSSSGDNRIVVGSPGDDIGSNVNQGSAYVYNWNGTNWSLSQKLTDSGGSSGDAFGVSVSVMGSVVAVGANLDDKGPTYDLGSVHIYKWDGADWFLQQKLDPPAGEASGSGFGTSVVFAPYYLAVGASHAFDPGGTYPQGAVFLYSFGFGGTLSLWERLAAPDGLLNDEFGYALASSQRGVVVGAYADDVNIFADSADQGSVYLFEARCGDVSITFEECDDGNASPGDGCSELCAVEPGFFCVNWPGQPSLCAAITECWNGIDDDGDGDADGADLGCDDASDTSEHSPSLLCDDGIDNDGDGLVDYPEDPGCFRGIIEGVVIRENPKCQDGLDNEGDGKIDFDGGAAANHGVPLGPADPQCTVAYKDKEAAGSGACGLGFEVTLLLGLLSRSWARRKRGV
jgi:cysteine-rich repeat protein